MTNGCGIFVIIIDANGIFVEDTFNCFMLNFKCCSFSFFNIPAFLQIMVRDLLSLLCIKLTRLKEIFFIWNSSIVATSIGILIGMFLISILTG